jgi:hypothetical protein
MDRCEMLYGFQFKHHFVIDDDIKSVNIETPTAVQNWVPLLALVGNLVMFQFNGDGARVDTLEKSGPQIAVYLDAASNHVMYERLRCLVELGCNS